MTDTGLDIAELNRALLEWETEYDTIRPNQALGYLTPEEFLKHYLRNRGKEEVSLRY